MKITLANGTELNPIVVTGGGRSINGTHRDTLNFIFPQDASLDELDALFTDSNCETIKLYETRTNEDGSTVELEHIHSGYTIRAELSRTPMVVKEATETTPEVIENRVTVSMAQRTYTEAKLAEAIKATEAVNVLLGEEEEA